MTFRWVLLAVCWPVAAFAQGSVMLVGGGAEDYHQWSDEPYGWFVQQADSGKIVNIDVDPVSSFYPAYFIWLGADSASHALRIPTLAVANDTATYNDLADAGGIFIEGGDQWDYVSTWKGTLVEDAVHHVFTHGGAIGGSSAGLAILGEVVFDARYGSAYPEEVAYDPYDSHVSFTDDFLEIMPGILTDTHFHDRGRLGRLVPFLARRIQDHGDDGLIGIGVEGYTAFCVRPDRIGTVYGEHVVVVRAAPNAIIICQDDRPVSFSPVLFDQLLHHASYDLNAMTMVDPGDFLLPVTSTPPETLPFSYVSLDGSTEETADLGEIRITGVDTDPDNWWYGDLGQEPGQGAVPRSVIMPRLWSDHDYYGNRWVGPLWGLSTNPHFFAIYLDDGCTTTVESAGLVRVGALTYLIDTFQATHLGANTYNIPGVVGATLHFLGPGDTVQLGGPYHHAVEASDDHRRSLRLYPISPNPFSSSTAIRFDLTTGGRVALDVLNPCGRRITRLLNRPFERGAYQVVWQAAGVPAGIYVVSLRTDRGRATRTVIVSR